MTEEEYLELKAYFHRGSLLADELRKKLSSADDYKLHLPSFEFEAEKTLSDDGIEEYNSDLKILEELWAQEEANNWAADLIWTYETHHKIK